MKAFNRRISIRRCLVPVLALSGCLFFAGLSSAKMANGVEVERGAEIDVARWSVDVSATSSGSVVLDAGKSGQTYALTVSNGSSVASSYTIRVSNIPVGVKIGLDILSDSDLVTPINNEVVFSNTGGDLGYTSSDNTRSHLLTLVAEPTANITQSGVDLAIDVQFVQKEPGAL